MGAVAVIVGALIVLVVALDVGLVVLHPTIPGPVSHRVTRMIWRAIRGLAVALGTPRLLIFAGPLTAVGLLFWWLVGFWIGFALIYLPFIPHFSASVHFGHNGFFDALYTSATMLTTLGLGDLLPTRNAMRAAVACEAATGVGTVSAAISYILSVYPLATQTRAHALYLSDCSRIPVPPRSTSTPPATPASPKSTSGSSTAIRACAVSQSSITSIPTERPSRSSGCWKAPPSSAPLPAGRRRTP